MERWLTPQKENNHIFFGGLYMKDLLCMRVTFYLLQLSLLVSLPLCVLDMYNVFFQTTVNIISTRGLNKLHVGSCICIV